MTVLWGMEKSVCRNEIIIPQDKAVFWMDDTGRWHNRHGPFEHPKIIRYFNRSIQKDEDGYFVAQGSGDVIEKVYFPFVVTALFVVDLAVGDPFKVKLNIQQELDLDSERLFLFKEDLYYRMENDIAKFNPHALLKISNYIDFKGKRYRLKIGSEQHIIKEANTLELHQQQVK